MKLKTFLRSVFLFPFNILMGMASGAISAQGTQFYQGTGSGGAVTITAITKAFKGLFTGTNTLVVGDRVTLADIVGMTEANGIVATVLAATSADFVLDVDTRGFTTYGSGGTATPITWTKVGELKTVKGAPSTINKLVKSTLDSTIEEVNPGLPTAPEISLDGNFVSTDPGSIAARAAFLARATKQFKYVLPNNVTFTFQGYYSKFPLIPDGAVDTLVTAQMAVQTDGIVTMT
jgi:hypothetical protein